jgi:hypothetical protein
MVQDKLGQKVIVGSTAGLIATLPMSIAMQYMYERLPFWQRYRLPPERITVKTLEKKVFRRSLGKTEHKALTTLSHFGYGTACGAAYAALGSLLPMPPILRGICFGIGVWASSYLGWLPALGILGPATRHPSRRTALMIVAHVVWGATTAILVDSFDHSD